MKDDDPRPAIHESLTVAQVLETWPIAVRVFLRRGMSCVGCVMAPHETLAEVARVYGFSSDDLVDDLVRHVRENGGARRC